MFSEQTVTFSLYNVNSLVFITEVGSVYSAVRNESLHNTDTFYLKMLSSSVEVMKEQSLSVDRTNMEAGFTVRKSLGLYFPNSFACRPLLASKITTDSHIFLEVNVEYPDGRYIKLKNYASELISDSYKYIPVAYVTINCMI